MEMNEVLDKLPKHLMSLVIDQPYNEYTEQDHAVWRYVMRQNVEYLSKVAHGSYLDGLKRTGISIDRIPHMYGMNRILKEIGWAAVAVDGFIPPAAFMEFQAFNVLVIAADIRPIDQIEYTPAPDIIHEAAGHALSSLTRPMQLICGISARSVQKHFLRQKTTGNMKPSGIFPY